MTLIEIKPPRWAGKLLSPGGGACVPKERPGNRLCAETRLLPVWRDSGFGLERQGRTHDRVQRSGSKAMMP